MAYAQGIRVSEWGEFCYVDQEMGGGEWGPLLRERNLNSFPCPLSAFSKDRLTTTAEPQTPPTAVICPTLAAGGNGIYKQFSNLYAGVDIIYLISCATPESEMRSY